MTSGVPQGPLLGAVLFSTFINDIDKGMECTFIKFADDTPEGQNAIHRNLDKFKKWTHGNLMQFNKTICKVLHLG